MANEAMEATKAAKAAPAKKKNKKPNIFVRFGKWCKSVFSELKKVTWPTFGKVVKQTGVVIAVVALFLVVISLMDLGLTALLDLLVRG